ncbi:hypothetical protein BH09VER1_BH09VER1_21010 [soil metagenome]
MFRRLSDLKARHPLIWQAILWAIPAILAGLVLRLIFLHYSPYAYWGADSRSYFGFTDGVLTKFYFSINEKRRYLYPIFLLPITLLPGGTLKALALIQAALGLVSLVPLAYAVRRLFVHWRWSVIPLTLAYAGMPLLIWQEHELISDTIFFDCLIWALAGWIAFASQTQALRARRLFWWFLAPFAIILLTKPSGLFFWPGLALGLILVGAYRTLRWPEWTAIALVFLASLTVGDKTQSSWLLYLSSFPLTRLDTPLHADYKSEIKDLVLAKRALVHRYNEEDDEINRFLRGPGSQTGRPLWQALEKDKVLMRKVYRDLAIEGITSRPDLFLIMGFQRLLGSCNPGDFSDSRFKATYFSDRFLETYRDKKIPDSMLRLAFGIPRSAPFPTFEELKAKISPYPDSAAATWLRSYAVSYHRAGEILRNPADPDRSLTESRPTLLGWLIIIGAILSLAAPWRKTLGVWVIASAVYLCAVYLVGIQQTRYFSAIWPICILLIAVVPDAIWRGVANFRQKRQSAVALDRR